MCLWVGSHCDSFFCCYFVSNTIPLIFIETSFNKQDYLTVMIKKLVHPENLLVNHIPTIFSSFPNIIYSSITITKFTGLTEVISSAVVARVVPTK